MRTSPRRVTAPCRGVRDPAMRPNKVVFPHPDGPTMATSSPRDTSSDRSRITSGPPKSWETHSRVTVLSLIPPPHAREGGQPEQEPVEADADQSNHDHLRHEQVHPQAVARIPDGEPQPVPPRD